MRFFKHYFLLLAIIFSPMVVLAKVPNDPYFSQWSFEDTGVYKAWDYGTGSRDVVVAIIDNGFDTFHPDLIDNVWKNENEISQNGIDDDKNGYIDDYYGWNFLENNNDPRPNVSNLTEDEKKAGVFNHATIVAGIIGAKGNNGLDGAGINWEVRLMNLKILGNNGTGQFPPLVEAIYYAVDNGADVINVSVVGEGSEKELQEAVDYAYKNNVIVVAAAGNNLINLNYSSQYPVCSDEFSDKEKVLGVSAMNEKHHLAVFSNSGSKCIDITAPGVDIKSTVRFSPTNGLTESYSITESWNGTSFSAPFVTGAVALLKSLKPNLSADKIIETLLTTVHHTPSEDEVTYANLFGSGLLQIDKAVMRLLNISEVINDKPIVDNKNSKIDSTMVGLKVALISSKLAKTELIDENIITNDRTSFLGVEDSFYYPDSRGAYQNVTLSTGENNKKVVSFYNDKLTLVTRVNLDLAGDYDLAIGNLDDYENLENSQETKIVLAPRHPSNIYLYIFDLSGNLLKTYHKTTKHNGASVYINDGKVVLAYMIGNDTKVETMDYSLLVEELFSTSRIRAGQIMSLDLNQDGKDEYLISATADRQAWLRIFTSDGKEYSAIRVYPTQYKKGFNFAVADYNGDGSLDFIFTPMEKTSPLKVISLDGQLITERFPFKNQDYGRIFTLFTKN